MYDDGMERQIRVKNKTYTIKLNAASVKAERAVFIENAVKGAVEVAQTCAERLSDGGADAEFAAVFGESGAVAKRRVRDVFCAVPEVFEGVGFLLKKVFVDKNGRSPEVLASADASANTISLYDAFFAEDSDPENDRSSVLLHEAAHLCGLKSDAESGSPDSAECVRNFALLVSGKMDIDELLGKRESGEADVDEAEEDASSAADDVDDADESGVADGDGGESESDEDEQERGESERGGEEMPYRPDQLRAPKGQSNGGQWVSEGGGSGGAGTSGDASISQQSHKTQTTNTPEKQPDTASTESTEEKKSRPEPTEDEIDDAKDGTDKVAEKVGEAFSNVPKNTEDSGIKVQYRSHVKGGEFSDDFKVDIMGGGKRVTQENGTSVYEGGLWVCNDMKISGLKPNSNYSVVIGADIDYTDSNGNKCRKKVWAVYDLVTDSNGNIIVGRIGWLNINNKRDHIDIYKNIKIDYKMYLFEGRVNENFDTKKKEWKSHDDYGDERIPSSVSHYLVSHGTRGSMGKKWETNSETEKYNVPKNENNGGIIIKVKPNRNGVEIANGTINAKHSEPTEEDIIMGNY